MIHAPTGERQMRRGRSVRFRRIAVSSLVLLTAAGGLTLVATRDAGRSAAAPPAPSPSADPAAACKIVETREPCEAIKVNGFMQRYALSTPATATVRTVVVDFGGPGVSVLADTRLSDLRAQTGALSGVNLLVLEEPWVTADVPQPCSTALQTYYRALRGTGGIGVTGKAVGSTCRVGEGRWGFTPERYRDAVREIARSRGLTIDGFIGHSWGGSRLAYLSSLDLRTAALVRPFPVGTTKAALVTARAGLIRSQLGVPKLPAAPTEMPSRSVPLTGFDVLSAWTGLGYTAPGAVESYRAAVLKGDPDITAELSDGIWRRYGTDSLAPSLLAELDEVCTTVGGPATVPARITTPADVLNARMAPCADVPVRSLPTGTARSTCIVTGDTDTVAPAALIRSAYRTLSPRPTWLTSSAPTHVSFDGLDKCLATQPALGAK